MVTGPRVGAAVAVGVALGVGVGRATVAVATTGMRVAVGVGDLRIAVDATSASAASELVGDGVDGGGPLHPTNNKRIVPMPIVCCHNLRMFTLPSFSLDAIQAAHSGYFSSRVPALNKKSAPTVTPLLNGGRAMQSFSGYLQSALAASAMFVTATN